MNARQLKFNIRALPQCYNIRSNTKAQKRRGGKRMTDMDSNVTSWIGWIVGSISIIGSLAGLIAWFRNRREKRLAEKHEILNGIKKLCLGQDELYERMDEMDRLRNIARGEDAQVRVDLYLGQVAMITAIRELGKSMTPPIIINGEVQKYYERNIDNLRRGVGMSPLNASRKEGE